MGHLEKYQRKLLNVNKPSEQGVEAANSTCSATESMIAPLLHVALDDLEAQAGSSGIGARMAGGALSTHCLPR